MSILAFEEIIEPNDQTAARAEHLEKLRELVGNVYPNKFVRSTLTGAEDTITALLDHGPVAGIAKEMAEVRSGLKEGERPPAEVKDAINERLKALGNVRIAGRLTTPPRGNFVHLTDGIAKLQIYCKKGQFALVRNDGKDTLDEENAWTAWQMIDHGDFIGVEGYLFVTNTGEVSVHVEKLQFLAKAMLPMPDKMHGIEDPEIKQRQRYVDLIGSSLQVRSEPAALAAGQSLEEGSTNWPPADAGGSDLPDLTTREVFERRAKIISSMRRFLEDHGYIEVETPMLTPKATGAAAKPFVTHHNALDITLYARIAPELYLKRLTVGGFEKVYELNRNFRNEGISYKHNPEFTMLEFYCAYMDVNGMMDFCEQMLKESVQKATGGLKARYEIRFHDFGKDWTLPIEIDFNNFRRLSMIDAILTTTLDWCPSLGGEKITADMFERPFLRRRLHYALLRLAKEGVMQSLRNLDFVEIVNEQEVRAAAEQKKEEVWANAVRLFDESDTSDSSQAYAKEVLDIFDEVAEGGLIFPTFVTDYPKAISPLAKANPNDPYVAERFELFINKMEVANGFSELNDPREQYERFVDQMAERERGDEEAMVLDEDYIRALSYGMPPAAGIGIGIDRLVMLLTNRHSIRDVILFPHMRPERNIQSEEEQ